MTSSLKTKTLVWHVQQMFAGADVGFVRVSKDNIHILMYL